ncbi:MAG: ABC transporter permease [Bacteroidota bacterium]
MNINIFIAKRFFKDKSGNQRISKPIVSIAVVGVALGIIVMILSVAIVTGFKSEIRNKITGFGSHIKIINYDTNTSIETVPISKHQNFYPDIDSLDEIHHIQPYAIKGGILKTQENFQGGILKGVDESFKWSFFEKNLIDGETFQVTDTAKTDKILISKYFADLLELKAGDAVAMYFVDKPPRVRKFIISGIYDTGLEDFDKKFILGDIKHVQKLNNWDENQISGFEIILNDFKEITNLSSNIRNNYTYPLFSEGTKLKVLPITSEFPQIFDWLNIIDVNVWVILTLVIVVAGFNMISGLLIIILERTSMIGLFKAMGSTNWSIRKIFLYFASLLIGKGMLWGNIIGIALCLIQKEFGIIKLDPATYYLEVVPINLKILHVILLNIGSLVITVIMLIIPSYIIAKISPIKTIRFN